MKTLVTTCQTNAFKDAPLIPSVGHIEWHLDEPLTEAEFNVIYTELHQGATRNENGK